MLRIDPQISSTPKMPRARVAVLSPALLKAQRQRNLAIGLAVGLFSLLFYVVAVVKLSAVAAAMR